MDKRSPRRRGQRGTEKIPEEIIVEKSSDLLKTVSP